MAEIRLNKIIRKYNIGLQSLVDFLKSEGADVEENPMAKIPEEYLPAIEKQFGKDLEMKEASENIDIKLTEILEKATRKQQEDSLLPETEKTIFETRTVTKDMGKSFIETLKEKRSKYLNPEQACTQAQSLNLLSSGIYTEEERFVFELLQNAVDSFSGNGQLKVKLHLDGKYLIFMHNGDMFSERDIEGLCDVGNGNKMGDVTKIGYKGVGFKSVFMHSRCVTVQSGRFCFRFDQDEWSDYWDKDWGMKEEGVNVSMPWQIIPLESMPPVNIDTNGYNVITYIHTERLNSLHEKVLKLFNDSSFLLFLRQKEISIQLYYQGILEKDILKTSLTDTVELKTNNRIDSRWIVYCNPSVSIPSTIREVINADGVTPIKLQKSTSFDLSFAARLNDDGIIEKFDNSFVYTYLPTSVSFGFPFLVNANFITDAGRQHLVKDSEWNKMILSAIPEEFLTWVSTFSRDKKEYYRILPSKIRQSSPLADIFNNALDAAAAKIHFVPSLAGEILLASNAVMDRTGISGVVSPEQLLSFINKTEGKSYSQNSFIENAGISILKQYGVYDFGASQLVDFLGEINTVLDLTAEKDAELIIFLYDYYSKEAIDKDMLEGVLKHSAFILDEDWTFTCPERLFIPSSFSEADDLTSGVKLLNEKVYDRIKDEDGIIEWLKKLDICEMDQFSIIRKHFCDEGYLSMDNAIEVGQYIFDAWENDSDKFESEIPAWKLEKLRFLTKGGELKKADELYQGTYYYPSLNLEPVCDKDIFVSEDYCSSESEYTREEWHRFFRSLHISDDLSVKEMKFNRDSDVYTTLRDYVDFAEKHEYNHSYWTGGNYYMRFLYINVKYIPFLSIRNSDHHLSKIIWSYVLKKPVFLDRNSDYIYGSTGYDYVKRAYLCDQSTEHNYLGMNFLPWVIRHYQTFPASDGRMLPCSQMYIRTPLSEDLLGEYLPYLDVNCDIDSSWMEYLHFKNGPFLEDYLTLLSNISEDAENAGKNRKRISKIYDRIVTDYNIRSEKAESDIRKWAETNLILSMEDVFCPPKDLKYITIEGFGTKNRVFMGDQSKIEDVIYLMALMGVKIITEDNVRPVFTEPQPDTDIQSRLDSTLPALAVLAKECNNGQNYKEHKDILQEKIEETTFFRCKRIELAYDDSTDRISKISFAQDGRFYYTGELRPAKMEPLLQPLCKYLGISGKERDLFVIMTEPEFSGIIEYLKDKEFNVKELEDEMPTVSTYARGAAIIGGQIGGGIPGAAQIAESNEAKTLVLSKLKEEGFDVCEIQKDYSVIDGVTRHGVEYPLVVKSCKNWEHKLFLNPSEWRQLFRPNSMLWLHLGNRVIAPIKAQELFTYQDSLTLTFDTVNLMMDDRIDKIMEVMTFFNNVHLNVAALNPDQHRAERLEDYLFDDNNALNSDLSSADID